MKRLTLFILPLLAGAALAQCPVEISAKYNPNFSNDRVVAWDLNVKNNAGKKISVLRFGIQSFTAFDEKVQDPVFETMSDIKPNKKKHQLISGYRWSVGQPGDKGYFVFSPDRIKFVDGSEWQGTGKDCTFSTKK